MSNKHIYRYGQFVVKKTNDNEFVVVNSKAGYDCHSHVKSIQAGKALCKLASKHKLPKNNDLYFIESLIRLSNNKKYLIELKRLKESIEKGDIINTKPRKPIKENINKVIANGIDEYLKNR